VQAKLNSADDIVVQWVANVETTYDTRTLGTVANKISSHMKNKQTLDIFVQLP